MCTWRRVSEEALDTYLHSRGCDSSGLSLLRREAYVPRNLTEGKNEPVLFLNEV
jgi:hypothetical protein